MANPIENWLYKGATQPRSYYANMPLWKAMAAEIPFSKSYEGFNPKYTGAGKVGLPRYILEGLRSLLGGQYGNIAGGTTGMRTLYERAAPWLGKVAKGVGWAGSAPATGILTALTPSAGAGAEELAWEKENERRMAEEAAAAQQQIAQQQAQTQQNIINQINQANQNNQGGNNVSGPAGMSGPSSSPPQPSSYSAIRKYGRADGGMVGMNHLTRRL